MTLTQIAVQNLRRRKGKTLFLLFTFLLVVGTITTLNSLFLSMKDDLQKNLSQYGANIIITPKSEHLALSYGGIAVSGVDYEQRSLSAGTPEKIAKVLAPGDLVAPKIIGSADGVNETFLIVGVDFAKELQMKPWWTIEGQVPDTHEVVIGSSIASKNGLERGNPITIGHQKLEVVGVMKETGGSEDNAVFTDFQTARELTGIQTDWSMLELNVAQLPKLLPSLANALPEANIVPVSQLVQSTKENVDRLSSFSVSISIVLVVIGTFVIISALAGNINDRVRELGIFRAIGFRKYHVLSLLGQEALILSFCGSLLGYLLGIFLPFTLGPLVFQKSMPFQVHLLTGIFCILGAMIIGIIAVIYPAWRVTKIDPQEALRFM